jgi:5,10-methenyltetrahydrofolate synthetase
MKLTRAEQRAALIAERRAIPVQQKKQWDKEIADQVVAWCNKYGVKTVGLYSPIQGEPSLHDALPQLIEIGIKLALPSAPIQGHALTFSAWAPGEELMKDRYGVFVPLETAPIVKPDVLFIPCVGYTSTQFRLGYGGGFYDRTLAEKPRPKTVGIAYRLSQCELELAQHDIPMDYIITNLSDR